MRLIRPGRLHTTAQLARAVLVALAFLALAGCSDRAADDAGQDLPPGRLAFVAFVPDGTGARHLTLHTADADGANARGVDPQLNGADGIVSHIPGTQQVIYPACPSPRSPSSCRPRIYDAATGEKRDIRTQHPALSVGASPGGEYIAYASEIGLYVADVDGGNERLLFDHGPDATIFSVTWSPDGDQVAFVASVRGQAPVIGLDIRDVYVMDVDGGEPRQLGTIGNRCDPLNTPTSVACSSSAGRHASADQVLWFSDSERLLVSGRQFGEDGHRSGLAGTFHADGSPDIDTGLSPVCELGNSPAICGLTHLLEDDTLALVRVGGHEIQLVRLDDLEVVHHYAFGDSASIHGIHSATWLPE